MAIGDLLALVLTSCGYRPALSRGVPTPLHAIFYGRPLLAYPVPDRFLVPLDGPPGRLLPAPSQPPQDPPDVADLVPNPGLHRDHVGHPLQGPELGAPAICARPLEQRPLHLPQLLLGQQRRPAGSLRPLQALVALRLPGPVPDAGALPRHPQLARHLGRVQALGEEPGGLQPPPFQGLAIGGATSPHPQLAIARTT